MFNADGNPQLTATSNVLGQSIPFVGEYGISKNPESFSAHSYRSYFTDKARGAVMRLSRDGLSVISDHGMKNWFNDNLRLGDELLGTYDVQKNSYNLTITGSNLIDSVSLNQATISFKENTKGWSSFMSFYPENGLTCNGRYYTFKNGQPHIHHLEGTSHTHTGNENRNNFYGNFSPSTITFLLNEEPGTVKSFHTLNYEGTQARVKEFGGTYVTEKPGTSIVTGTYSNPEYYNLLEKLGWYASSIVTDMERGSLHEFIEKEGKWFNYIRGKTLAAVGDSGFVDKSNLDFGSFGLQGLGAPFNTPVPFGMSGCTDPTAFNYEQYAQIDNGSCVAVLAGCDDSNASNYDSTLGINVTTGCLYYGCTSQSALNTSTLVGLGYNVIDDGSCQEPINGCIDNSMFNYNASANVDDGSCVTIIYGCMDSNASNLCQNNCNVDDGSCMYDIPGCTDPLACFYGHQANVVPFYGMPNIDDGSCWYCSDPLADNYDMPYHHHGTPAINNAGVLIYYPDCNGAVGDCTYAQPIATWPGDACSTQNTVYGFPLTQQATVNTSACQGYGTGGTGNNFGQSSTTFTSGANTINPMTGYSYPLQAATTTIRWEDIKNNGINAGATDPAAITPTGYLTNPSTSWAAEIASYNVKVYDDQGVLLQTITGIDDGQLYAGSINGIWPWQVKEYELTGLGAGGNYNAKVWGTTVNGGGVEPVNYTHVNFPVSADQIAGCIQPNACNYVLQGLTAPFANPVVPFDQNDPYAGCIMPAGCSDPLYLEYDNTTFPTPNVQNAAGLCGDNQNACITPVINGCMDITAFNYNSLANVEPINACVGTVLGCMDNNASWDNSFIPSASNYDSLANSPGPNLLGLGTGSFGTTPLCNYQGGCPSLHATSATKSAGSGYGSSPGGFVSLSADFSKETQNHISISDRFRVFRSANVIDTVNPSGTHQAINSSNYSNFGSNIANFPNWNNYDLTQHVDANGQIDGQASGNITFLHEDSTSALQSHPSFHGANTNYGSWYRVDCSPISRTISYSIGCTDPTMFNYDASHTISDDVGGMTSSCIPYTTGCMSTSAINYNPAADQDDGSCVNISLTSTGAYNGGNNFTPTSSTASNSLRMNIDLAAFGEVTQSLATQGSTNTGSGFVAQGSPAYIAIGDSINNFENYFVMDFASIAGMPSDPINYQLTTGGKAAWVIYMKITDSTGGVHTDTRYTSQDGWFRVEGPGGGGGNIQAPWKEYGGATAKDGITTAFNSQRLDWYWQANLSGIAPNYNGYKQGPSWENIGLMIEDQLSQTTANFPTLPWRESEGTGSSHSHVISNSNIGFPAKASKLGLVPAGTQIDLNFYPIIDTRKLPTWHPEYTASLPSGNPGDPHTVFPNHSANKRWTRENRRTSSTHGITTFPPGQYAPYIYNQTDRTVTWVHKAGNIPTSTGTSGLSGNDGWNSIEHNYATHDTGFAENGSFERGASSSINGSVDPIDTN